MTVNIHEILYKKYSEAVQGYTLITPEGNRYFVINSVLPKADAEKAYSVLVEASASALGSRFILLQGNGQLYKSDNLQLTEKEGAAS